MPCGKVPASASPAARLQSCSASPVLQRVHSFHLRASLFGEFNIDSINNHNDTNIVIDDNDQINDDIIIVSSLVLIKRLLRGCRGFFRGLLGGSKYIFYK